MSTVRDFHVVRNSLLMDKLLMAKNTHIVKGFAPGEFYDLVYPVALVPKVVISVVNDTAETDIDTTANGNVLTNDFVSEGSLSVVRVAGSSNNVGEATAGSTGGLFTIGSDGAWTFDPNGDFDTISENTDTSITYTVGDDTEFDSGTLTVAVQPVFSGPALIWSSISAYTSASNHTYSLPADLLPGDLVVVMTARTSTGNYTTGVVSPTGYTVVCEQFADDVYDSDCSLSYKVMGSTPDITVTTTGSLNNITYQQGCTIIQVWRNVDPTTPLDVAGVCNGGVNSCTPNPGAITPVTDGAVIITLGTAVMSGLQTPTITAPTGSGLENVLTISTQAVDGGKTHGAGIGTKVWNTGDGTIDFGAWNGFVTSNASQNAWATITVALRPAS